MGRDDRLRDEIDRQAAEAIRALGLGRDVVPDRTCVVLAPSFVRPYVPTRLHRRRIHGS